MPHESKLDRVKTSLEDLVKGVTIQGIPKILTSKRKSFKFIWLILFIGSSLSCAYFVTKCFVEYFNYEYITSIKTIVDTLTIFPAISICSYYEPKFEFTILNLEFDLNRLSYWKKHFEPFNDPKYGRCYRFNSGINHFGTNASFKKSTRIGYHYGLKFDFYIGNDTKDYSKLIVYIHNSTQAPLSLFNKGYFISSGNFNSFVIQRIVEEKLPEPYNSCFKDINRFPYNKTLIEFIKQKKKTYSQNECHELCQSMIYIESGIDCNCSIKYFDDNVDIKCNLTDCLPYIEFIQRFQNNNPYKQCDDYCPLECDSFDIESHFFFEDIPSSGSIDNIFEYPEFKTYENVSKNFYSIYVYYEDLKYTLITQKPVCEIFDLVSNIGGLFGLFLGMGILSFIEIFEIFFEALLIFIGK